MGETVGTAGEASFEAASGAEAVVAAGVDAGAVGLLFCGDGVLSASLWYDTLKDLHWQRRQALAVDLARIVARLSMMDSCDVSGSLSRFSQKLLSRSFFDVSLPVRSVPSLEISTRQACLPHHDH